MFMALSCFQKKSEKLLKKRENKQIGSKQDKLAMLLLITMSTSLLMDMGNLKNFGPMAIGYVLRTAEIFF